MAGEIVTNEVPVDSDTDATLYNLAAPDYDSGGGATLSYASIEQPSYPQPPPLPQRPSVNHYHYEVPDPSHLLPEKEDDLIEIPIDQSEELHWTRIVVLLIGILILSFCGGMAGASALSKGCSCTTGTVVFATQDYAGAEDLCWAPAVGSSSRLNLEGLYIRPGTADMIGTVLNASVDPNDVMIETRTVVSQASFAGVIGSTDTGVNFPRYFKLSNQSIAASHGSRQGWAVEPQISSDSYVVGNGINETRPRSIILLPLICQ